MMANEVKISLKIDGLEVAKDSLKNVTASIKQTEKTTKGTDENLKKVNTTASKTQKTFKGFTGILSGIGSSFKGLTSSVFSLQGAATAFVSAFAAGKVISAANTQEDAINALNVALKGAGEFSVQASEDFQNFASELQQVSTFGDESTLQMIAFAKSLGVANDQTKELITAAADASAATGRDFRTSVEGLIQTLSGAPGTFARVVPAIRSLTKEQLQAGEGIKLVANLFEGAAKGQLNTFRGALTSTQNAFGDLLEEVGFLITKNPAVISAVNETKGIFEDLGTVVKENREEIISLVVRGINFSINAIGSLVKALGILAGSFDGIRFVVNSSFGVLSDIFANVIEQVALVSNAFTSLFSAIGSGNFLGALQSQAEVFFTFFLNGLSNISDTFSNIFGAFGDNALTEALDQASVSIRIFSKEIESANEDAKAFAEGNSEAIGGVSGEILSLANEVRAFGQISKDSAEESADSISSYQRLFGQVADTIQTSGTGAIEEVAKAQADLLASFSKAPKDLGFVDALSKVDFTIVKTAFDNAFKNPFSVFKNIPEGTFDPIKDALSSIGDALDSSGVSGFFSSVADGARTAFSATTDFIGDLFGEAADNAEDELNNIKIDPKELEVQIKESFELTGAALGFTSALQKGSKSFLQSLATGIGAAFGPLGEAIGGVVSQIIDVFGKTPEEFQKAIVDTIQGIPQLIGNIIINIARLAGGVFLSEAINGFINNIPLIVESLAISLSTQLASPIFWTKVAVSAVFAFVGAIPEMIQGFIDGFKDGFGEAFSVIGDFGKSLSDIWEDVLGFVKDIGDVFSGLGDFLKEAFGFIKDIFKDIFGPVFDSIKNLFSGIFKAIKDSFSSLFNLDFSGIFDAFKGLGNILLDVLKKPFEILSGLFKKIFKFDGGGKGTVENFIGFDFPFIKFSEGGLVPGQAKVTGNSPINDTIPALLSPGEIVLPRSVVERGIPAIKGFLDQINPGDLAQFGVMPKGGQVQKFLFGSIGDFFEDLISGAKNQISRFSPEILSAVTGGFGLFDVTGGGLTSLGSQFESLGLGRVAQAIDEAINIIVAGTVPDQLRDVWLALRALGSQIDIVEFLNNPLGYAKGIVKALATTTFQPLFKNIVGSPLQNGGTIPSGFPNDSFPARLTSGELVVPRDTVTSLERFLDNQNGPDNGVTNVLLTRVVDLLERPLSASASVDFDERTFADILLTLNRNNARTA